MAHVCLARTSHLVVDDLGPDLPGVLHSLILGSRLDRGPISGVARTWWADVAVWRRLMVLPVHPASAPYLHALCGCAGLSFDSALGWSTYLATVKMANQR